MGPEHAVTLQINVAPTDLPHARSILPHQLRAWAGQVEEILFSFDLHRTTHGGRFGEGWEERLGPMRELLDGLCREYANARIVDVDYGAEAAHDVAVAFSDGVPLPEKDTKGAPFYPYFHGLWSASNELVLHLDSDMMFGGSSQTWTHEAAELLRGHRDVLACSPLPGPPTKSGELRSQPAERFEHHSAAYRFRTFSTRVFLIDRQRLRTRVAPLNLLGPARLVSRLKARLHGNPPFRAAELVISEAMLDRGVSRVDFLGAAPGMWSLHPPYRPQAFLRALPQLVRRIESGDVTDEQRGEHDLNDSMLDLSAARRRARVRRLWA